MRGDTLTTVSSSVVGVKFSHQPSVSVGRPPVAVCLQSRGPLGRTLSTLNIKRGMNQFVNHKTASLPRKTDNIGERKINVLQFLRKGI